MSVHAPIPTAEAPRTITARCKSCDRSRPIGEVYLTGDLHDCIEYDCPGCGHTNRWRGIALTKRPRKIRVYRSRPTHR